MTKAGAYHHGITPSQAWSILTRHAREDIEPLRLQELCRDNDRVSSLVAVYTPRSETTKTTPSTPDPSESSRILIADLSRQRMTLETLNHLFKLANARQLRQFITQLAWGQNNPRNPVIPARLRNKATKHSDSSNGIRSNTSFTTPAKTSTAELSPGPPRKTRFLEMEAPSPSTSANHDAMDNNASRQSGHHPGPASEPKVFPTMHLAFRVPAGKGHEMYALDGTNVLIEIHREWERLERLSEYIRRGQLRGVTGSMLRDVVVIGRGVAVAALEFVYSALLKDEQAVLATRFGLSEPTTARIRRNLVGAGPTAGFFSTSRRMKFLSSVDPVLAAEVVTDLDPGSTLVVSIALNGNEETGIATKTLKNWLLQSLGTNRRAEHILAKHMILVTGNDRIAAVINKPEMVHMIPEHSRCEAFTTFSAATLVPLSIVFGWHITQEFIDGAHDLDNHFVSSNPRHNLPTLLALCDVWNDVLLGSTRMVIPFTKALSGFPKFVGTLEAQTCSRVSESDAPFLEHSHRLCSPTIIDGGLDGKFDRISYQATPTLQTELVMTLDSQIPFNLNRNSGIPGFDDGFSTQDSLMCSLFAHVDELAFGSSTNHLDDASHGRTTSESDISEGNRPSLLIFTGKLDAFACGQLVALSEHRSLVKAHIWGLDPFVRETGSSFRMKRTDQLKDDFQTLFLGMPDDDGDDEDFDGRMNLSTKTILRHYAAISREQKLNAMRGT